MLITLNSHIFLNYKYIKIINMYISLNKKKYYYNFDSLKTFLFFILMALELKDAYPI